MRTMRGRHDRRPECRTLVDCHGTTNLALNADSYPVHLLYLRSHADLPPFGLREHIPRELNSVSVRTLTEQTGGAVKVCSRGSLTKLLRPASSRLHRSFSTGVIAIHRRSCRGIRARR